MRRDDTRRMNEDADTRRLLEEYPSFHDSPSYSLS